MSSRLSAIELKRAKLEELRRLRLSRRESLLGESVVPKHPIDENTVDLLVKGLVDLPQPVESKLVPVSPVSPVDVKPSNYISTSLETGAVQNEVVSNDYKLKTAAKDHAERITYDKATQTCESDDDQDDSLTEEQWNSRIELLRLEIERDVRQELQLEFDAKEDQNVGNVENEPPQELVVAEKVDEFKLAEFVARSLKIVDKSMMSEGLLIDYENDTLAEIEIAQLDDPLHLQETLYHEIVGSKSVTAFDWSLFGPLLAVSYSTLPPQQRAVSNKGVIIVWDMRTKKPEFIFEANTEILTVKFALHKRNVLYAGGYNGKILQYDFNSASRFPVAQSPLSSRLDTHSHPIYAILQINSSYQNAGVLVTASTDGKICQWSPFLLDKPISDPLQLKNVGAVASRYDEEMITAMVRLSNGSLLLGGSSLTVLENLQTKFKPFDARFHRIVTALEQYHDQVLCASIDAVDLYSEQGECLKSFASSSIIMDVSWLDLQVFVAAVGHSLELFDTSKSSNFAFFALPTNEHINKLTSHDNTLVVGTELGKVLVYRYK